MAMTFSPESRVIGSAGVMRRLCRRRLSRLLSAFGSVVARNRTDLGAKSVALSRWGDSPHRGIRS